MNRQPPEVVPGPAAPLPPGLIVSEADLADPATAARLAGLPADFDPHRPAPDKPAPETPTPASGDIGISPCRRCGWDGQQTVDWMKKAEYPKLVDQLLFDGVYTHTFKLGPIAVTFRTLSSAEEDGCWDAAVAELGVGPTAQVQAVRRQNNYEFAVAVTQIIAGERRYAGPEAAGDPKAAWLALSGYLKSAPIRSAIRGAYNRFLEGVGRALVEAASPNF